MWSFLYKLASPRFFYHFSQRLIVVFSFICLLTLVYGVVGGFWLAPADYQQGDAFRIIYIHVPSAFMSMGVYVFMAFCALLSLVWRIKLADIMIKVSASLGAWFTFLALFTGALWGKPMWGTWWIWDARLTSELILFFLYLGLIALQNVFPNQQAAARPIAIWTLIGVVNIPIIHYSVYWWNTLHQGSTLLRFSKPTIAPDMLYPLLAMIAAFLSYFVVVVLMRARTEILMREAKAQWIKELL